MRRRIGRRIGFGKFALADRFGFDVFLADALQPPSRPPSMPVMKIGDVEKAGLLQPDIDERGLHPGQHARYLALVDISYEAALPLRSR